MKFVIFLFYFQNLLTGVFSKSISYCTSSICSVAACYSFSSFSKFEEADVSSGLEAGVGLAFFGFFTWGGSEDWCLVAMLGKKKKKKKPGILPGEESSTARSENSDFFIFKFYFEI